jgi:DNA-directed RNA polymerase sigma subunit (sigma70/sigma32)
MSKVSPPPAVQKRIATAKASVDRAESALADARQAFRDVLAEAVESGVTLSALARELGITRQRVQQLLK